MKNIRIFLGVMLVAATVYGCGPKYTYPSDQVPSAVEKICKDEYQMAVKARVVNQTLGAVYYINRLIDAKGQIDKDNLEKVGQILLALRRVALSTDAKIEYCVVYFRDRATGQQVVVTQCVEDALRANAEVIGPEESMNRVVWSVSVDPATAEKGKKNPEFVLKAVSTEDFLVDQIVQRIRYGNAREAKDSKKKDKKKNEETPQESMTLVDGNFKKVNDKKIFRFSIIGFGAATGDARSTLLNVLHVVDKVFSGYKYTSYDSVEIQDYLNRLKLVVSRQTLLDYQNKKITEEEILKKFLVQSRSIQDALKLFNFNAPQEQ